MTNMTCTLGGELPIYRLGYGALQFTGRWGLSTAPSTARGVLRRAVELGVNFIDTSDAYGPYTNEHLIADALHPYPDTFVIATKDGFEHPKSDIWIHNAHPQHLLSAVEGSLQRLRPSFWSKCTAIPCLIIDTTLECKQFSIKKLSKITASVASNAILHHFIPSLEYWPKFWCDNPGFCFPSHQFGPC